MIAQGPSWASAPKQQRSLNSIRCNASIGGPNKGFNILELSGKLVPQGLIVTGARSSWNLIWETMVRELAPQTKDGAYVRPQYSFNSRIGDPNHPVAPGRYHLYVGNACPWCHRVLLALAVRGLAGTIGITHLLDEPERATRGGWIMGKPEPVFGATDLWQVYDTCSPGFKGRCTAPLLVDKVARSIVSNESGDMLAMINDWRLPGSSPVELRPQELAAQMEALNDMIYSDVNNAVYQSGFATSQAAYSAAQAKLYSALQQLDSRLADSRFLAGDRLTETDLRLLPTIARYDAVYTTLFKCSSRRVSDYPHLHDWLRDIWQLHLPWSSLQIRDTIDIDAARVSYFTNLFPLNPGGIVPSGPSLADLDLGRPAGRGPAEPELVFHMRGQQAAQQQAAAST